MPLKFKDGSGSPSRVFAVMADDKDSLLYRFAYSAAAMPSGGGPTFSLLGALLGLYFVSKNVV